MTDEGLGFLERDDLLRRVNDALEVLIRYGSIDGDHHKVWVLDQVTRRLTGPRYEEFIRENFSADGYRWDVGIAP